MKFSLLFQKFVYLSFLDTRMLLDTKLLVWKFTSPGQNVFSKFFGFLHRGGILLFLRFFKEKIYFFFKKVFFFRFSQIYLYNLNFKNYIFMVFGDACVSLRCKFNILTLNFTVLRGYAWFSWVLKEGPEWLKRMSLDSCFGSPLFEFFHMVRWGIFLKTFPF